MRPLFQALPLQMAGGLAPTTCSLRSCARGGGGGELTHELIHSFCFCHHFLPLGDFLHGTPCPIQGRLKNEKCGILIVNTVILLTFTKLKAPIFLLFILTLWGSEHLQKYLFSHLPYKLLYFIYNLLVQNQKFHKIQKISFFPFKFINVKKLRWDLNVLEKFQNLRKS